MTKISMNRLGAGPIGTALAMAFCLASAAAPAGEGAKTEPRKWEPDAPAVRELAALHDPTFASVAQYFPMMQYPREAVGVPEGPTEFVVLPEGALDFSNCRPPERFMGIPPENKVTSFFVVGRKPKRFGLGIAGDAKRLVEGYLPMVIVPYEDEGLRYRQTVFAWSEGMKPDARLWAYVGLEVENPAGQPRTAPLRYQFVCGKSRRLVIGPQWKVELAPHAKRRVCVKLPRDGGLPDKSITKDSPEFKKRNGQARLPFCGGFAGVAEVEPAEFDRRLEEAARVWRELLGRGMTIRTPEPRINDAYRAWLAYTFLNVDKEGDRYVPHDGSGFYEDLFAVIAAKYCRALDAYGYADKARLYLDTMTSMVRSDGEFKTCFGLADEGSLLVALDDHYRFTADRAWLERNAPTMARMCRWIAARRAKEKAGQDPQSPNYGLIKYTPSADFPQPDYNYITDASLCVGLESAAHALRAVGRMQDAQQAADEAAAYRRDILASMDRAVFTNAGERLLPILPASRGWLLKADYGAYRYYTLFGSMLLDTEFLPADDPRAVLVTRCLETRGGLHVGVCAHGPDHVYPSPMIDHAFTYGYWLTALTRNEPKRAILGLYASLAYGITRGTYGGVEVTTYATGHNQATIPHLRSGTQQLRLLRSMLLREDGDRLLLAQAVPQHWLADGCRVAVLDAPTCFGKAGYTIESHAKAGRITVKLDPPTRTPPKAIVLHLRHPNGAKIRSVTMDGAPVKRFGDGAITLEGVDKPVRLEVRYQ